MPETAAAFEFPLPTLQAGESREIPLQVNAGPWNLQRKWRLSFKPTLVVVAAFPERYQSGQCLRKNRETSIGGDSLATVNWADYTCGAVTKKSLAMHPPYHTGVGYAFALFESVDLPNAPKAMFRCQVGKGDGSDPGDGILYRVAVVEPDGRQTVVTEKQWIEHAWTPIEADLSSWAGKRIRLKLIADVGPADNSSGDWACWTEMRIESAQPVPLPEIQAQ